VLHLVFGVSEWISNLVCSFLLTSTSMCMIDYLRGGSRDVFNFWGKTDNILERAQYIVTIED